MILIQNRFIDKLIIDCFFKNAFCTALDPCHMLWIRKRCRCGPVYSLLQKNGRTFKGKPGRYHCFNLSGGAYQYIPPPAAAAAAAAAFAAAASSFFSAMSDSVVSTIAATEEAF